MGALRSFWLRPLLLAMVGLPAAVAPFFAHAGEANPPVVLKVVVRVDGAPAPADMAELVSVKAGDPYSPAAVDLAVKALFKSGLFADIRVEKAGQEKVELTFLLTRNLTIRRLVFKKAKVRSARLKEAVESLREGGIFQDDLLPKAAAEVKEALRREGYFDATVDVSLRRVPKRPSVDVVFAVGGAKRYRVGSVALHGSLVVPEAALLRRMKSRPGAFYLPSRLDRDIQALSAYYASLGYPRVDIPPAAEHFQEDKGTAAIELEIQPHE